MVVGVFTRIAYLIKKNYLKTFLYGELSEWFKEADLKSVGGDEPSVGSNPTLSANKVK